MLNYKGVVCVVTVSLSCLPCTMYFLSHRVMSQLLPMYAVGYGILLTAVALFILIMPPDGNFWKFECRGIFYYVCCILACINVVQLSMQFRRFSKPGRFKLSTFFATDEVYLKTPFGMSSILWNNGVCYLIYLVIVFAIDNCSNVRNIALYWCGGMITSEFVIGISLLSGPTSHKLQYSSVVDVFYICVLIWVLNNYLIINPRIVCPGIECRTSKFFDICLIITFLFSIFFTFIRCMGVLNSSQYHIKYYRMKYEPYMGHKSNFGAIWILFSGAYGIPCQILAIYYLYHSRCRHSVDISLLYAGSMLQGTVVYLSYNFYPSSEKAYRFPTSHLVSVMTFNIGIVVVAHLFLFRCLWSCTGINTCSCKCYEDECDDDIYCFDSFYHDLDLDCLLENFPLCEHEACGCSVLRKRC